MLAQSGERQRSGKRRLREGKRTAANRRSALRKCRNAVSAGVLSPISSAVGRNGAVGDKRNARAGARNYPRRRQIMRLRRCGGESIFPWRGGGLRRPHFFLRRKKCGKESRLDLRFKDPLARCGSCRFGGMYSRAGCSGHHCRSKGLCLRSPARRLPRPLASATVGAFSSAGLGEFRRRGGELAFP